MDTLFVVALVNERDPHHRKASALAEEYEGQPMLITDAVLLEIGNALARRFKPQAVEVIDGFLASDEAQVVHLNLSLFERGYALYEFHQDKGWGLVDCISFVVMREAGVHDVLTFDQHFIQAGFRTLMR